MTPFFVSGVVRPSTSCTVLVTGGCPSNPLVAPHVPTSGARTASHLLPPIQGLAVPDHLASASSNSRSQNASVSRDSASLPGEYAHAWCQFPRMHHLIPSAARLALYLSYSAMFGLQPLEYKKQFFQRPPSVERFHQRMCDCAGACGLSLGNRYLMPTVKRFVANLDACS